ncbi:hypothetical protein [Planococcus lenghuensis]|uniref:Uncharacterized protein n=1 Tax=Planococcus lenghuensis TaxID=2213202 RepID=A0A1Q2L5H6_9BACL|nr:hypothetical protein [Planococcus lenghuensis]AQQ55624.1 hypothetical protein B0X71_20835 [Planococcus lenghuensis]
MQISKGKKEAIINTIIEKMKVDKSIMVGSLTRYNLSNVNDIRKLHLIKDQERNTIYCKENEIARGYVRPLNWRREAIDMPLLVSEDDLCKRCVNKFIKERYSDEIEKLKNKP